MGASEERARNRETVNRFFAADLSKPQERLALWAEDGVKELPWAPANVKRNRWEGRAELEQNAALLQGMLTGFAHVDVVVHPSEDPELFWATSRSSDAAVRDGRAFRMRYVHMLRVRDGRIVHHCEYFDTQMMLETMGVAEPVRGPGDAPAG